MVILNNIKVSREEYTVLQDIKKDYKWISRDSEGNLCVYENKPYKCTSTWEQGGSFCMLSSCNHLFLFVRWTDENPTFISNIIEKCQVEENSLVTDISVSDVIVRKPFIEIIWSDGIRTTSKCNEKDKFDIEKGVYVAISKRVLQQKSIKEVVEKAKMVKYYNGSIVCVEAVEGCLTVGKIYNVVDGYFIDNKGNSRGKYYSFEHLQSHYDSKFIEIVK